MKFKVLLFAIISCAFLFHTNAQQITTDDSQSLEQLIQNNFGQNCVEVSNIVSSIDGGVNNLSSYGSFDRGNSNFPFENGIVLTTGNVNSAGNTLNTLPLNEGENSWGTDTDLEDALGITETLNATSIQFNFITVANQIQFNYIFASEEYQQQFVCSYSDGFAFLIREAGSSAPFTNIALVPNTNTPVNTTTIHDAILNGCPAINEEYFEGYNIGDTNYNGRTVVMTATANIQPNVNYEIKLVIADQTDKNFDSAVFIEGNSFNANVDLGPDITTCGQSTTINGDVQNPQASYQWYQNDVSIAGANGATYDATESGTYKVEVTIQLNQTSCVIEDEVVITLDTEQTSTVLSDFIYCDDSSNDGIETFDLSLKDNEVLWSVPPSTYNISYHYSEMDADNADNPITSPIQNTSSPQSIFVRIEDTDNGCLAFSSFNLIVNPLPEFVEPHPITACEDSELDGFTFIDLNIANTQIANGNPNLYISYHYSQAEADFGFNPIFSPYTNLNTSEILFVRIYDASTGCYVTTTIDIIFQNGPNINTEDQWINACEQDFDGFEEFDLTSVIDNVLQGLTGVSVSFYESYFNAQNAINPIADTTNYQNIQQGLQVVYIRVEDDTTGCFSIVPLELHANIIQTGFSNEAYYVCDDPSNDGIEDFDLADVEDDLKDGYDEFEVTFYETEEDRDNEVNALNESVPYTVSNNGTTIYAIVVSDICTEFVTIELVIAPAIILEPVTTDYCDDNFDGFAFIYLDDLDEVAGQDVPFANVDYYLSEEDALNDENALVDYHYNTSNPQLFYIRVRNGQTGCYGTSTLEVNIVTAPVVNYPEPIIVCDDDSDGIFFVNLESKIPEIITNSSGLEVSFYNNYNFAIEGTNQIVDTDNYNTPTQYIYVRVENELTGCYSISGFYVYINTLPEFIPISDYENCEANVTGVADFYFYIKDNEILNGQPNKQVLYYETAEDAENGTNPIDKYSLYQNTSSPQTIYVRVESYTDSDCYGTSSFELIVGALPIFTPATDIFICDDISNDGLVTIDLNDKIFEIADGSPQTLDITFHTTLSEANAAINAVDLNYTNSVNPQQLFARVDNGTYCFGISEFEVNIIPAPLVYPANPQERCDDNYDGILTWDLTLSELEILDVRQDDIVVSYFTSIEDLEVDLNPITDPENYDNVTNPQTVYVKVNNTISNCFVSIPLDLIVNLPPAINDFESVEICDNSTSSFDLTTVDPLLVTDLTDINITYHNNQADADNDINPIDTNFIYTATSHTFIARAEFITTGCYATYPFELIINPLPIANTPLDIEVCDDVSNDTFEVVSLLSQNSEVLQGQDASLFLVSYHNSSSDAQNGSNPLSDDYNAENNQTIFVRVTNNITGCYATTEFNTIVYPAPSPVNPIVICDTDYDGINVFDLTIAEADLYATIPSNVSITYFETIEDLETDANQINDPTNYTNLSNPQEVYIKVFNNSANCYTTVPLEISTNLPPTIFEFEIYEICDNPTSSFNLTEVEFVLVDDSTNILFSYYDNYADADSNSNALSTNYTYTSINDIIYVRIENATTGCFYVYDFTLQINPLPIANQPNDMEACDDDSNDGLEAFDIESQTNAVLGSQSPNDFTVTYYLNPTDAANAENAVISMFTGTNEQLISVRIENNETGCFSLTDFTLIVNPHPNVPQPLTECDIDYDAMTPFNLTSVEPELLAVPNPDNIITYFTSLNDLQTDTDPILDPTNYSNTSNPQTIYIKVYNTVADCFTYVPLNLNVNLPPALNDFEVHEICENESNTFDLSTINDVIVDINFNVLFSYFASEADAQANQNALDLNYIYTSSNDIIYARIEFSTTHCYYVYPFELRVNPLPVANQPDNLENCDDDFDSFLEFDLEQQTPIILGNQNPNNFSITYYSSNEEAEDAINPIEGLYDAFNGDVITARIENNTTGCYNLVEFSTIVHRKPNVIIPDQVVCIDNLPLLVSAETFISTDSYVWSTNAITPEIEITEIGTYSVTVTSDFGCVTTSTFNVTESESATIELTEIVDFSDPNNITITISGIGNYLYILDDGQPQESNVFENVAIGYHTVTIIDLNGCAEVTKEVLVIDAPKHLTPNNDGAFDTWHIVGIETLPGSIVYIFDRYGKLLKQLGPDSRGWDGTYNGNNMPASDYWFLAEIRQGGISFEVKGHFALRR